MTASPAKTPKDPSFRVPLNRIREDSDFNVRIDYGDILGLAIQLMTAGQLEPVTARQEGEIFYLVNGYRRRRAMDMIKRLRIEKVAVAEKPGEVKYKVFEGDSVLRDSPGPISPDFTPNILICRPTAKNISPTDLFASQFQRNGGKAFTSLEKILAVSKLRRMKLSDKEIALKTGLSRTHITNAGKLNQADPRLLEFVSTGKVSQKIALRLLQSFPASEQIVRVEEALARAEQNGRNKLLPRDVRWPKVSEFDRGDGTKDRKGGFRYRQTRVEILVDKLADVISKPPNKVAEDRLKVLKFIHAHITRKVSYTDIEAFLLGRV